jgi:glycosyltransferase involved in cell wall biosynthesis
MSIKLTILTATLNAEKFISRLIDSLQNQSDTNFEWLVVDGGSNDKTCELIKNATGLNVRILCGKDFGIYDALNRGVTSISDGYYLVVGADDVLTSYAVEKYRAAASTGNYDIITTSHIQGGLIVKARSNLGWLYGLPGVAGSHAVGMIINVNLHRNFGLYSKKFPIAADQLFIKTCLKGGAKILRLEFIAGEFSNEGTSGTDPVSLLTDIFRVQILTEKYVLLQFLLFAARFLKLYVKQLFGFSDFKFKFDRIGLRSK